MALVVAEFPVREAVEAALDRVRKAAPAPLVELRHDVRLDSLGELAVYVTVVVKDPPGQRVRDAEELRQLDRLVRGELQQAFAPWTAKGWDAPFAYTVFRLESEQRALDTPGARQP